MCSRGVLVCVCMAAALCGVHATPEEEGGAACLEAGCTAASAPSLLQKGGARVKNVTVAELEPPIEVFGDLPNKTSGQRYAPLSVEQVEILQSQPRVAVWPKALYAYIKFGYGQSMRAYLKERNEAFKDWVDAAMKHVQTYYNDPSLPTTIQFKYDHSETIFNDVLWDSTDHLENWGSFVEKRADTDKVDLYVWVAKDRAYYGTVGLAYVGGACSRSAKIRTSVVEARKDPAATAMVIAHELGHNFGMSHDFDPKHGGDGGSCNGEGIMSYGHPPAKWSSCSVADFTGYYMANDWGNLCLKSWDAVPCSDDCPGSLCPINPDTFCQNSAAYGGCNGQFKSYFDTYCKHTCGHCNPGNSITAEMVKN